MMEDTGEDFLRPKSNPVAAFVKRIGQVHDISFTVEHMAAERSICFQRGSTFGTFRMSL